MSPLLGRGDHRRLRKHRTGANPVVVGLAVLAAVVVATWFGFTKDIPFTRGYELKAVFSSATSIRESSPVRIAGVNVGKVKRVERHEDSDAAVVVMEIGEAGLPVHADAKAKIRPRIFLEGNFFVDLQPGSPSAERLDSGDVIPITNTATPVQLDQVLTALQGDTRDDLKAALEGYGTTLTHRPTALEDRGHDPAVRGETAAESLNDATRYAPAALRSTAIVNEAFLGLERHDLSELVRGLARTTRALARNESDLKDLVTNFNRTMAALAAESDSLRASVGLLPGTLRNANRALASLNAAFPSTRAFAREIIPGVRETPATIDAALPWIAQMRRLLGRDELRGLVADLRPSVNNLARVTDATIRLLPQVDLLALCATRVLLPTGEVKISDGALSTGRENYKEFWYTMVGLAGEGQNFDGNGMYVRFQPGGGDQTVSTGPYGGSTGDTLFANAAAKPLGTRPVYPQRRPPYVSSVPCHRNKIPDLNSARTGPPETTTGPAARARSIGRPRAPRPSGVGR